MQEVVGTFLYYARALDVTMLPALESLATQQASPTENTMTKVKQFLDYAATHPDAIITYHASDMVLAGHSDASHLSETKPAGEPAAISSCPATRLTPPTTTLSSQHHR